LFWDACTEANAFKASWRVVLDAAKAAEVVVATMAMRTTERANLLVMTVSPRLLSAHHFWCAFSFSRCTCAAGSCARRAEAIDRVPMLKAGFPGR
jgi:hypothetical protein